MGDSESQSDSEDDTKVKGLLRNYEAERKRNKKPGRTWLSTAGLV